ncbi:DUF397 domain-containing protein [Streptomyces erythrochromogenes]|uniref:DUF397 domain-containing protein n=1 Tax=Streptomyces erythrochromogenes TaxID=285574 RepID=UPI0037CD6EA7
MGTQNNLTGALWRRSSYSGGTGGDCVECAPLDGAAWRKASYSANGDCVEVAAQPCRVAVRDSKNPGGPVFTVAPEAFTAFVRSLRG